MKINLVDAQSAHDKVMRYIVDFIPKFAKEHDIDQYVAMDWTMTHKSGLDVFSNWLTCNRMLTTSTYLFENDDGKRIAMGFDIVEDELFTLMMMKLK